MYKLAKDSAVKARTQAIDQLKAVLVIAVPALRERLSRLGNRELFRTCARLGPGAGEDGENAVAQATHTTLRMLAERIEQLTGQRCFVHQIVEEGPAGFLQSAARVAGGGESTGQPLEPVADIVCGSLDQAVGVEREDAARLDVDRGCLVRHAADGEGRPRDYVDGFGTPVPAAPPTPRSHGRA